MATMTFLTRGRRWTAGELDVAAEFSMRTRNYIQTWAAKQTGMEHDLFEGKEKIP